MKWHSIPTGSLVLAYALGYVFRAVVGLSGGGDGMASWCPDIDEAVSELHKDAERYLAAVDTFRAEGCEPQWSNAGEFIPDESVYVPRGWERRQPIASVPVTRQKSWLPKEEEDGA